MSTALGAPLPGSWPVAPLKHVTSMLNRGSAPDYVDSGPVRAISQAANQASGLNWSRTRFHNFSGNPKSLKGHLRPNDVLINSTGTGTLGRVGYFTGSPDGIPCMADSHVTVARAKTGELDARFSYYWLSSRPFQDYISSALVVGATSQIELNRDRLGDAPVPLPPLAEQRRIADFLDAETARIDQLTAASHRQFGLINERFTESIRVLTTTAGLGEVTPTGISWMPAMASSWKLMKIGRCFATSSGTTPRSSDANYYDGPHFWVNTGDLRDGAIEQPKKTVTDTALAVYPTLKIYAPESLVVAMYGATTGRVGILKVPACVNQACCVLSELGPLSSRYAFFWFRAHREEVLKLASGGGQPNISQDLVRSLRIPAPSRYEQDEIVDQAESLESMSSRQQHLQVRRAELLAERRQSLITAAVTGQFDVSTASGRNVTDGVTA
ncbi:restriction endonuclease subunit S [Streptomyces albidoflavus]|uniref:restriction endonuclease subunit S n=1 Tax=Streptomyces albidoflavus TaxID=1886 RepID=UPI0033E882B6